MPAAFQFSFSIVKLPSESAKFIVTKSCGKRKCEIIIKAFHTRNIQLDRRNVKTFKQKVLIQIGPVMVAGNVSSDEARADLLDFGQIVLTFECKAGSDLCD